MPSAAVRRLYEDQIPSFMSVYGVDSDSMDQSGLVTLIDPKLVMGMEPAKSPESSQTELRPSTLPLDAPHKHHISTSTQTTESAESSPTTTVSCADSSDLSDPSPSSSPDSPVNIMPLSNFAPPSFAGLSGMAGLTVSDPTTLERPMTSPAPRRPKNMKGLSIQAPFSSLSSSVTSEPSSPSSSFIKPVIPGMKRKPSLLSLNTKSTEPAARTTIEIPRSPSVPTLSIPPILQRRALKHSTSSPHMLSGLKSATFGPPGGMSIPTVLERNETGLSTFFRPSRPPANGPALNTTIAEEDSPIKPQMANRSHFDIEPFHEVENNEDQKTPGYPDGPICIYPDNVFLYLEPTAEEAAKFDLVINVAREVYNPFKVGIAAPLPQEKAQVAERSAEESPIPDTALTAASFSTAFEYFPDDRADTPTTPKAQPLKEPEYVHMPWDHNTDIGPELMSLCELIDKRSKEGKKVLIHCQQGASRSASLIIAYGIYRNPELSVNDAYYAAQARSRWISPNMRLMYCLQDFQKEMSKKQRLLSAGLSIWSGKSPTKQHRVTLSVDNMERTPKEPLTAPLPNEEPGATSRSPDRSPTRPRGSSTPNREPISPGPSSAPSSFSWTEKEDETDRGKFGRFEFSTLLKPALPDSGFASSNSFSKPPPSPGFPSLTLSRPPPSPGFPPASFSLPPMSPGFAPEMTFKPPPSPGFGAHRFGGSPSGFGFVPLTLNPPIKAPPMPLSPPPRSLARMQAKKQVVPELPVLEKPKAAPQPLPVEKKEVIPEVPIAMMADYSDDDALMSPRVETMTSNPFHEAFSSAPGLQLIETPPSPSEGGMFSPRETMFPRNPLFPFHRPPQVTDPRSPPTKGETPIVRSIDEMI